MSDDKIEPAKLKVDIVSQARNLWPAYASFEEDKELQDAKWNL
jgi:hypothetical protein